MNSFAIWAIFGMILAASGEEFQTDSQLIEDILEGDALNLADMLSSDTAKRAYYGSYGSGSQDDDVSISGSSEKEMCESKVRRAVNRIKKCEIARGKIATELANAAKKILKLEKTLEVCKHKKTCNQLNNDLLGIFHNGAKGALKCLEGAFKPKPIHNSHQHRPSGSSDSDY